MKPNFLNTKTSPDAKTGIALLMKALDKHAQTSQPTEEGFFARILDEKTAKTQTASFKSTQSAVNSNKSSSPAEAAARPHEKMEAAPIPKEEKEIRMVDGQTIVPSDGNGSTQPIIGKLAPVDTEDASSLEMPAMPMAVMIADIRQITAMITPELQDATPAATMEQKTVHLAGKEENIPSSSPSEMTRAVLGEASDPLHQAAAGGLAGRMATGEESTFMASSTVTAATANSQHRDVVFSSDSPAANHIPEKPKGPQAEAGFLNRIAEIMQQKDNGPAEDGILADIRRVRISAQDPRHQASLSREVSVMATEIRKPVVAETVNDRGAGIGQTASESATKVELPDQAVFMKNSAAAVAGPARDHEQSRNAGKITGSEQDGYPFPIKTATVLSPTETRSAAAGGPSGTQTQAIINQILDAKQAMSSDFGRVRIVLEPPNLGTVDLEIIVRRERVEVVMTADNAGVQQALQSRADDVRSALQRQDLKIETFQVLLQDNGSGQQQANSGAMYEQRREGWARLNAAEEHTPALPVLPSVEGSASATGQLSVFA